MGRALVQLTPGQYKKKTAYHIDPLMAESVEIVEPEFFHRNDGEVDASDIVKEMKRKHRVGFFACLLLFLAILPYSSASPGNVAFAHASTTVISPGDSSMQVAAVQLQLRGFGYSVKVDGIFGPQTERAVRHFQRANGLVVDGIVGKQTQRALELNLGASVKPVAAPKPPVVTGTYKSKHASVEQWHALAIQAGWSEALWPNVACIIWRESRGQPGVVNSIGATGLMQVMQRYYPGVNLTDPFTNLQVSYNLYKSRGWKPWALAGSPCL
jgi:Putative peptidoglycan binding domain/Transglycosylase SLT domain